MARGLVGAGAYRPLYSDGRRRRCGPDEDPFTLAAAAIDHVVDRLPAEPRPATIVTFGLGEAADASSWAAVLAAPVARVVAHGVADDPTQAWTDALHGSGPWCLVAASESAAAGSATAGDGAVAYLLDDAAQPAALPAGPSSVDPPGATSFERLLRWVSPATDPTAFRGDWEAAPAEGPAPGAGPTVRGVDPPFSVSQGAFVPEPRYLEGRPSRWGFVADRCGACGVRTFPSRGRCRSCGHVDALRPERLPRRGARVLAATWIGPGGQPTEFDAQVEAGGPYGVVLAELAPDVRVTLPLTDARAGEVRVGSTVDTSLRRLYPIEGRWRYGRKAVPARQRGGTPARAPGA